MLKRAKETVEVLSAISSPVRIQILKLLASKGSLTYSEIMEMLNLEPTKDAGKFVYHLKNLVNTGLIAFDKTIKKYKVTELGLMVINFSQDLEEYALKKAGRMLVRTSRYTIEEFDRSKITMSLIEEAGLTPEVAEKISSEDDLSENFVSNMIKEASNTLSVKGKKLYFPLRIFTLVIFNI